MPRNQSGQYTIPLQMQPNTLARASDVNTDLNDIGDALTDSLSRTGKGGMLAPLKSVDGSTAAPGLQFVNEGSTGLRRAGNNDMRLVVGGVDILKITSAGIEIVTGSIGGAIKGMGAANPGDIKDTAATNAPTGWMFCDGRALSRTTYASLFAAIGTAWGAGDGSTTFNIPDFRGRIRVGRDDMGGTAANRVTTAGSGVDGKTLGATGGAQNVVLTAAQLASHTHTGSTDQAGNHQHGYFDLGGIWIGTPGGEGGASNTSGGFDRVTAPAGAHSHAFTTSSVGNNEAHNNMPPVGVVNTMIYTGVA